MESELTLSFAKSYRSKITKFVFNFFRCITFFCSIFDKITKYLNKMAVIQYYFSPIILAILTHTLFSKLCRHNPRIPVTGRDVLRQCSFLELSSIWPTTRVYCIRILLLVMLSSYSELSVRPTPLCSCNSDVIIHTWRRLAILGEVSAPHPVSKE